MTKTSSAAASPPESQGGKVVLLTLLGLVVLAAVGYGAAYAVAGEKVPRGAAVAGVKVGGLEPSAAEQRLRDALADREAAPVRVRVADESESLDPTEVGLAVDYEASIEEAGAGRSWRPERLWEYYTGGTAHDAVLDVDDSRLDAAVEAFAERVDQPPVEGAIVFERAQAQPIFPEPGAELDADGSRQAIQEAFLTEDAAELPVDEVPPAVDEQAVRDAMADFVEPALSAPVVVVFDGDTEVRIRPRAYADALSVETVDGEMVPQLNEKALVRGITPAMRTVGRRPRDASFKIVGGEPHVVPARRGVTYDRDELVSQFLDHVTGEGDERRIELAAEVERPKFTTAAARKLGIKEEVSSFTTNFPYAEYRNVNLGRAAQLIDGTVLKPGETFSLNETTGERTAENGFTEGFIISNGVFREDFGGGVSQIATTVFNAAFFAGLEDVEHKPHSFYIDRYPVGREATVAWGAIDLRFRNDTGHGVLIKASVKPSTPGSQGAATVTMYSTKVWDIGTDRSARHNTTQPETRYIDTDDCVANEGYGGFDIDVYRYFRRPGKSEVVKRETISTTYTPSDTVICGPEPGQRQAAGSGDRAGGGGNG
ncbi:MAG: VanW family protein [Nocardioides sp.]|nr:VanW family protein [Nocardioides sp.]